MKTKHLNVLSAACVLSVLFTSPSAEAELIGEGLEYTWSRLPGQIPGTGPYYLDDGHNVYSSGLGTFGLGDLTDGVRQTAPIDLNPATTLPLVAQWPNAPQVDVTFDLGGLYSVEQIIVGTNVFAPFNNNAPSNLSVAFSTTDLAGFGSATAYDLEGMFGPLADGSHDLTVDVGANLARYVRLTFGAGSMTEPGGQDPNEKWMLDEISFNIRTVVDIDIKPGSPENTVNLGSQGVTNVAILSSDTFDATQVDPLTVELADATVKVKGNGNAQTTIQDVNGDGFLDLVLHIETEGFSLTDGDVSATLTGSTFDGEDIVGTDAVRVVP